MRRETLLNLKSALRFAEVDIGINSLSADEKEFFYDILKVVDEKNIFQSDVLRDCSYSSGLPHATYHRLLKKLLDKGFIKKVGGRDRNLYNLALDF